MTLPRKRTLRGSPPLAFGEFEWAKTINWKVLLAAVVLAIVAFLLSDVIPAMENAGGLWAGAAMVVVPLIRAVQQWFVDNSGKRA